MSRDAAQRAPYYLIVRPLGARHLVRAETYVWMPEPWLLEGARQAVCRAAAEQPPDVKSQSLWAKLGPGEPS